MTSTAAARATTKGRNVNREVGIGRLLEVGQEPHGKFGMMRSCRPALKRGVAPLVGSEA